MLEIETNSSEQTIELGKKLGALLKANDVILLAGDLGAGKTTLTKGIGKALGVNRVINSPTFTIVKEYHGNSLDLFHLDLYRLDGLGNDFDLEEYFTRGGICVCEWPLNVKDILPNEYLLIEIYRTSDEGRMIKFSAFGKRYEGIVGDLNV